jgi:deoxyribodipyrimidine photo-lyase
MPEYHERRDYPAMDMTSRLSPYLTLGIISVRQCLARLHQSQPSHNNAGADTWLSELIWREFYQHLIYFWPEICKGNNFHEWANNLVWNQNGEDWLRKWQSGETGYPIVDAAMRQLNQTGWMHNRLRMIVASFLTKDLHIDWRHGEQYFMRQLIDGDFAANNGGWQWSASTGCDGQPYFRIFNPITQGERFDPHGQFIRQYIPELSAVPDKYIHSPWLWGGVKSLSYPAPIVDHKREREITLGVYKEAKGT